MQNDLSILLNDFWTIFFSSSVHSLVFDRFSSAFPFGSNALSVWARLVAKPTITQRAIAKNANESVEQMIAYESNILLEDAFFYWII